MLVTRFSASWFARNLRAARRIEGHAALVSPKGGTVAVGTGDGYGVRRLYKHGRYVRTVTLPYPLTIA